MDGPGPGIRGYEREDHSFSSRGTRCAGWLYRPLGAHEPPVVIMGHGFAAERTFRLPAYAEVFARRGLAVFLFDYRNFGDSDGEPRNLVNPFRHVEDWESAIDYVRSIDGLDPTKVGLWGSSFGGGHALVAAAKDSRIIAVVAQVPFLDGPSMVAGLGLRYAVRCTVAGFKDLMTILRFEEPYWIPFVGDTGTPAVMNTPESKPGYLSIVPEGSGWQNRCPARIAFSGLLYRPIKMAHRVRCPVLLVMAEKDSLIHARVVERAASLIRHSELLRLPLGHFDVYHGEGFEKAVRAESEFLVEHLAAGGRD